MIQSSNPALDLTISRVIKAPRPAVWGAWTDRASFEQWWVPAPAKCKVLDMDLRPGGSFVTRISENGGDFMPHLNACFLAIDDLERDFAVRFFEGFFRIVGGHDHHDFFSV